MLAFDWTKTTIKTNRQANEMIRLFKATEHPYAAFDTETNGLHIILSRPFYFQFGWIDPSTMKGYSYAVDLERQPKLATAVIKVWHNLVKSAQIYVAHNTKFDLHMLANIGLPYDGENISDTLFYIRYAHNALLPKYGGPPLALKEYAKQYIDPKAKFHEKELDRMKTEIIKGLHVKLKQRLKDCGKPPEKYNARSYTAKVLNEMFSDPIFDYTDLPEQVKQRYLDWLYEDVPRYMRSKIHGLADSSYVSYQTLDRATLDKYAHFDIVYTLEILYKCMATVQARKNQKAIEIENKLIYPLFEMERQGFLADKEYLEESRKRLKDYILERRKALYDLCGVQFSIGQHELIKKLLNNKYGVNVSSTNSEELTILVNKLIIKQDEQYNEVIEFINIIQELRTLEKWYSAYIMRFIKDLDKTDRLYTTINQVGTVSGRVTSDFQQFPKKGIKTHDGKELFNPRRAIKVSGGDYDGIVYLDYSQIELRFQAFYTILVGNPDLNMCRAYMPYKCINTQGELFDYTNREHIKNWDKAWYYEEDPTKLWEPTDLHGVITTIATGLKPGDEGFTDARKSIGKRTNFAKNYGAKRAKIRVMFPDKTEEEITKIDEAYYTAYPGVKDYHKYCYDIAVEQSYATNLFGIKYYGVSGHKLVNMLVQGSAAFYLKTKIIELYDYCKKHQIKSKFQMNIHDELSWEKHKDELSVFFEFKHIMEDWEDSLVPIVADMEATKTNWAEKEEINNLHELHAYFSDRSIG